VASDPDHPNWRSTAACPLGQDDGAAHSIYERSGCQQIRGASGEADGIQVAPAIIFGREDQTLPGEYELALARCRVKDAALTLGCTAELDEAVEPSDAATRMVHGEPTRWGPIPTSAFGGGSRMKAICRPSGDQVGSVSKAKAGSIQRRERSANVYTPMKLWSPRRPHDRDAPAVWRKPRHVDGTARLKEPLRLNRSGKRRGIQHAITEEQESVATR
jgi:hypothetical protein